MDPHPAAGRLIEAFDEVLDLRQHLTAGDGIAPTGATAGVIGIGGIASRIGEPAAPPIRYQDRTTARRRS
jgi:hypothetical protein